MLRGAALTGRRRPEAIYVGNGRVLVRTPHGFKMFVDGADVSIAPHLILDGRWEEWTETALRRILRSGMTVLEVGANVGFFTLIAARAVGASGRVVALEADPELAQIARDNVEINGLHRTASVEWSATGDRDGEVTFYTADRHRGNGTLVADLEQLAHNASDARRAVTVPCTTLDTLIASRGLEKVDVLRIDAEGAEAAILRGAAGLLAHGDMRVLMMEFAPGHFAAAGEDPRATLERLRESGFSVSRIDERTHRIAPTSADELLAREISEIVCSRGRL